MAFPKQIKDIVYKLLQEPTLDNFREFYKIKQVNIMQSTLRENGFVKTS